MAIRFSRQARADLLDLWLAIAQHEQAAADRTVARIERACANVSRYPEIGQAHPEIAPDTRVLVVEDWRVSTGSTRLWLSSWPSSTVVGTRETWT